MSSWANIVANPPPPPNLDQLLRNFENYRNHDIIGGWDELYNVIKNCGDLLGTLDLDGTQDDCYEAVRSKERKYWDAVTHTKVFLSEERRLENNEWNCTLLENKLRDLRTVARNEGRRNSIIIFDAKHRMRSTTEGSHQILDCDLHGLHKDEALQAVQIHIWFMLNTRSVRRLNIIPDHIHSSTPEVKEAKEAVEAMLKRKNLFQPYNNGAAFLVTLEHIPRDFKLD